jgi:hypothetical protein
VWDTCEIIRCQRTEPAASIFRPSSVHFPRPGSGQTDMGPGKQAAEQPMYVFVCMWGVGWGGRGAILSFADLRRDILHLASRRDFTPPNTWASRLGSSTKGSFSLCTRKIHTTYILYQVGIYVPICTYTWNSTWKFELSTVQIPTTYVGSYPGTCEATGTS